MLINIPTAVPMGILLHLFFAYLRLFSGLNFGKYDPVNEVKPYNLTK
jgi:hypothetical protein